MNTDEDDDDDNAEMKMCAWNAFKLGYELGEEK